MSFHTIHSVCMGNGVSNFLTLIRPRSIFTKLLKIFWICRRFFKQFFLYCGIIVPRYPGWESLFYIYNAQKNYLATFNLEILRLKVTKILWNFDLRTFVNFALEPLSKTHAIFSIDLFIFFNSNQVVFGQFHQHFTSAFAPIFFR